MIIESMTQDQIDALTAAATGTLTVVVPTTDKAAPPSSTPALDYTFLAKAVVTVNGVKLTEGTEWTAGTSVAATATSLAGAITTATADTLCTAAAVDGVITLTANDEGAAGNSISLGSTVPGYVAPSAATLLGGSLPEAGQLVYNSDDAKLNVYTTAWEAVTSAS